MAKRLAVVRDKFLNPWDASNYYGVAELGVELLLCGTPDGPDWTTISAVCPEAKCLRYHAPWEVLEAEPDVIDVPDPFYSFSQYFTARFERTVVVGWETLPGKAIATKGALECIGRAWKFTARSELAMETLMLDGAKVERVHIIPGAVNTGIFTPGSGYDDREAAVLFVGRDAAEKGLADLICAMHGLKAELWVAGSFGNHWCKRLAERYLVNVKWLGHVPWLELPELYRKARVFCMPSIPLVSNQDPYANWTEQFGQVLVEAMACGTPIVTTDCGAIPEVIGEAGIYSASRDWVWLHDALAQFLYNSGFFEGQLEAGIERVNRKYTQAVVGKQIVEWYFGG